MENLLIPKNFYTKYYEEIRSKIVYLKYEINFKMKRQSFCHDYGRYPIPKMGALYVISDSFVEQRNNIQEATLFGKKRASVRNLVCSPTVPGATTPPGGKGATWPHMQWVGT